MTDEGTPKIADATMTAETKITRLQRLQAGFDFVTRHFAVLSLAAAVMGAVTALIFIAAYLRVFDWRTIWIIEYSDVLKVGLIAVSLLSGFSYFIFSAATQAIDLAKQWPRTASVSLLLIIWCISLGFYLYGDLRSAEPLYALHIWLHVAILAVIALVLVPLSVMRNIETADSSRIALVVFLFVLNVSTLGTAFGYYTRDTEGFNHDVFLKSGEEMRDVGVVMLTSHHVVLYAKDSTVIVVSATDVTKLERRKPQ
jgi:hypothetical protein